MKNDGGAAFPNPHTIADANDPFFKPGERGMTLRDWFAGMALQALITAREPEGGTPHQIAIDAYDYADKMLREKNNGK